jgi:hypothetical protein
MKYAQSYASRRRVHIKYTLRLAVASQNLTGPQVNSPYSNCLAWKTQSVTTDDDASRKSFVYDIVIKTYLSESAIIYKLKCYWNPFMRRSSRVADAF